MCVDVMMMLLVVVEIQIRLDCLVAVGLEWEEWRFLRSVRRLCAPLKTAVAVINERVIYPVQPRLLQCVDWLAPLCVCTYIVNTLSETLLNDIP